NDAKAHQTRSSAKRMEHEGGPGCTRRVPAPSDGRPGVCSRQEGRLTAPIPDATAPPEASRRIVMVESPLHIRLLGGFELRRNGSPLPALESARAEALLAYLLLHRDSPQSRQHL